MKKGFGKGSWFASLLVLTALACNFGTSTQSQPPPESEAPQGAANNMGDNSCGSPYYPGVLNATWSYRSTGSPVGEYAYTESITSMRPDGFTTSYDHEGFSRSQEWSCTPQGLIAISFDGGPAAAVSSGQFQLDLTTTKVEGISLPAEINPGDQWTQIIEYQGSGNIGGNDVSTQGTVTYTFNALGIESVTVPAGTFTSIMVKTDIVMDVQVTFQGSTVPAPSSFSMVNYWVKDIGLVKTETSADLGDSAYSEVIELQAYSIP